MESLSLDSWARQVEQASAALLSDSASPGVRKEADGFLQQFRSSSKPYAVCFALLRTSQEPSALFQALSCIKVALLR